ncbi:MAG TPA: hypothetical protein VFM54_23350 [Micromonosporaceae bacterium]|nr:hypothetical protein [Micromonosporaceae bacterium]
MAAVPEQQVVFASAERTATVASDVYANRGHRGLHLVIDVTAITATPSVVFTVQGHSPLGDDYYTVLASAAITGTGTTVLRVYPGCIAAANSVANDALPPLWRVHAVHGDADAITYSANALLLP